jgi:transcriptional regulator with XRE-family HTH domain
MSSTPFGEHLRREREMRGVSLDEISAATRISTRFLEAIEKDQWDQLPGGVFNRGFIRSIARFLGLDEDSLVAEYALGTASAAHIHVATQRHHQMPRNWRPAAAAVVAVTLLVVGGVAGYHRYGADIGARIHARYLAARAGTNRGAAGSLSALPQAADTVVASLDLKMQAAKPADVKVIADGKVVFEGAVQPDEVKQFDAQYNFEITSSESSAISLKLNGQTVPMGTSGQPGSVTLTRNDLKTVTGGSN